MRKTELCKSSGKVAGVILFLLFSISCERNNYDILDPATAGVWTLFDTKDGLPGNTVTDIKRDSRDNLWMTFPGQGTAKYSDGTWTYYRTANSQLLNNVVSCLAETSDGSIIFGTATGLSILSKTNTWNSVLDPVTTMVVTAVKVAANGTVWVGTAGQGFYVNNGSGYVKNYTDAYKNVNIIEEDQTGNIWIGTNNGLIKWNGTSYSYLTVSNGLPDNRISSLRKDSKRRLWIGTRGGKNVSWIDIQGIHQMSLMNGRDSTALNDIFEDRSGNIWFATASDGLIWYDGIIPHTIKSALNGLPENSINSIGEDKDGNLWFGLASKGVARYSLPIN